MLNAISQLFRFVTLVILALFFVAGCDGGGSSNKGGVVSKPIQPGQPQDVNVTPADTAANLTWDELSPKPDKYTVYWSINNPVTDADQSSEFTTNSANINGLTNGVPYYFMVSATNTAGESVDSAQVTAEPAPAPKAPTQLQISKPVQASPGQAPHVKFSWQPAVGAKKYYIYVQEKGVAPAPPADDQSSLVSLISGVFSSQAPISDIKDRWEGVEPKVTTALNFSLALEPGKSYDFAISAVNDSGETFIAENELQTANIDIPAEAAAPKQPSIINKNGNELDVRWEPVDGVQSYRVYYGKTSELTKNNTYIEVNDPHIVLHQLDGHQEYHVAITSVANGLESALSSQAVRQTLVLPQVPSSLALVAGNSQISASWAPVIDAHTYKVYWGVNPGISHSSSVHETSAQQLDLESLANGQAVYVAVAAVNALGESSLSAELIATPLGPIPNTPSNINVSTSASTIHLDWGEAKYADSYAVYWSTSPNVTTADSSKALHTNHYEHTPANNNAVYFRVLAKNASGDSVLSKEVNSALLPIPTLPMHVKAVAADGQITVSWNEVNGASAYELYWDTTAGVTLADTKVDATTHSATVSGLNNGTPYYFAVRAVNASGQSALSADVSAAPLQPILAPGAPIIQSLSAGDAQLLVKWNGVTGADSYSIYYDTSANVTLASPSVTGIVGLKTTLTGLTNGSQYYVAITATNSEGDSPLSSISQATNVPPLPLSPSSVHAVAGDAQATVQWSAVPTAVTYELYWQSASSVTTSSTKVDVNDTHYTLPGLTNGDPYYFAVRAINATGNSALSAEVTAHPKQVLTIPLSPTNLVLSGQDGDIKASWHSAAGATSYRVYYSDVAGVGNLNSTVVEAGNNTSVILTGLTAGKYYYVKVSAVNLAGESALSAEQNQQALPIPARVMGVNATAADSQITFTWPAIAYSESYELYWSTAPGVGVAGTLQTLNASTTHVTLSSGIVNGTSYYATVRARNASGAGGLSSEVTVQPQAPTPIPSVPSILQLSPGIDTLDVQWSGVTGADSYTVYYDTKAPTNSSSKVANVTGLSTKITGLVEGSAYYVAVSASNTAGESVLSSHRSTSVPLAPSQAPTNVTVVPADGQITVSWDALPHLAYELYWSTSSGVNIQSASKIDVSGDHHTLSGLDNGRDYFVALRAVNATGESMLSSEKSGRPFIKIVAPNAPAQPNVVAQDANLKVSWTAVAGATSYTLYHGTSAGLTTGASTSISAGSALTYTLTSSDGLVAGANHYVALLASNSAGGSALSAEVSAQVLPIPQTPTSLSATGGNAKVTFNWGAVSGADSYELYWSNTSNISVSTSTKVDATDTHVVISSGVVNGTTYYAKVRAKNASGSSALSAKMNAGAVAPTPKPGAPHITSTQASGGTTNSDGVLTLNWAPVTGAASYTLYYGSSAGLSTASTKIENLTGASYTLSGLGGGSQYYVSLVASNVAGNSALSNEVATWVPPLPNAPSISNITAADGSVSLQWNSQNHVSYEVYWSLSSNFNVGDTGVTKVVASDPTQAHATLTGLTNGADIYVAVLAKNASGSSALSAERSARPFVLIAKPAQPNAPHLTAGATTLTVNWSAVAHADSYRVYYGPQANVNTHSAVVDVANAYTHTLTLTPNATYHVAVAAVNRGGESVLSSESYASVPPVPSSPTGVSATASDQAITVDWNDVANVASSNGYKVYFSTTPNVSTSDTQVLSTNSSLRLTSTEGIVNGTSYYMRVLALNTSGESSLSQEVSAIPIAPTPIPSVPSNLSVTVEDQALTVNWPAVSGATSYHLYWSQSPNITVGGSGVTKVDLTGLSHHLSGLSNGQPYYFKVSAENVGGESALSSEKSASPMLPKPAAPTAMAAISGPSDAAFTASWNAVATVVRYRIFYSTGVVSNTSPYMDSTGLQYEVNGLVDGQAYHVAVAAINTDGTLSDLSQAVSVTPTAPIVIPVQVSGLAATPGKDTIRLNWNAVPNADAYTVYWETSAGVTNVSSHYRDVSSNTITLSPPTITTGATYHFKVLAKNAAGAGPLSAEIMSRSITKPATPVVNASAGNGNVELSWSAVSGSNVQYQIYYAQAAGVNTLSSKITTSGTRYTVPNLNVGSSYYFKVAAVSQAGSVTYAGDLSAEVSAIVLGLPGQVTNLAATASDGAIDLTWAAVNNATSYTVYYANTSGVGKSAPAQQLNVTAPASSAKISGLTNGYVYYVAIKANNTIGSSLISNEVSATPLTPPSPIGWWNLTAANGALDVRYSPVSGATTYNIYWSETAGVTKNSTKQSTSSNTAYTISGLQNGKTYYVSVSASSSAGESALAIERSAAPRVTAPSAPKDFKVTAGDQKVVLTWKQTPNAIAYNVFWAAGSGIGSGGGTTTSSGFQRNSKLIPSGSTTSITIDSAQHVSNGPVIPLINGSTYYFSIQAVNSAGDGAKAAEQSATPAAATIMPSVPTGLAAISGDEAVTLSWTPVSGASSYKVYWGAGSVGSQFVANIDGTETAIVTGLTDGTSYSFTVAAVNAAGESAQSSAVTASPLDLIDAALINGDSSKLGASEETALITRILHELSGSLNSIQTAAMNAIYGGGAAIKYDPGKSSQLLACADSTHCIPILVAQDPTKKIHNLAFGTTVSGTKAVAYGTMPPALFLDKPASMTYQPAFKKTIEWVSGIDPTQAPLRVAVVNLNYYAAGASGYSLRNWIQREYLVEGHYSTPSTLPAGKHPWTLTFCDGPSSLPGQVKVSDDDLAANCFANKDLVIIGDGMSMSAQRDASKLAAATKTTLADGVPVMFFTSGWSGTAAGKAVINELGMSYTDGSGNYFTDAKSDWKDYATMVTSVAANNPIKTTLKRIQAADYFPDWSQCKAGAAGRIYCIPAPRQQGVSDYAKEFEDGAMEAMNRLKALEVTGTDLFSQSGSNLEKLLVLLGDVYRKQIIYPMEKSVTDDLDFMKASFADHTAYNIRKVEFTPPDMGDFFDVRTISSISTGILNKTFTPNARGGSTSVGAYLVPGKKVTITRNDSGTKPIKIYLNMMRPNGTREFDKIEEVWSQAGTNNWVKSLNRGYSRPKFVQSSHISLPPNGSLTLVPAYGGPLYADITGETADVSLDISNGAQLAFLQDGSQQNQVTQYETDLSATNLPWTDIKTNFVEIHSLTEFMRGAIKPAPYNGDLAKLLEITWQYEVKDTYDFAGFTGPGLDLPQKVKDFCSAKSWNCVDADIHASPKTLHINTDYHASCGGMCSGNPFDSSEYFNPLGWGESHELGHNLQRARLKIFDRKTGEVSNNIFPLHKMSSYYKVDQVNISSDYWKRLEYSKTFKIIQDAKAATPGDMNARMQAAFQAIWSKTGAYDQNGERVTFYRQIAHLGDMQTNLLDAGWDIFTLIHLHERLFDDAKTADAKWQSTKDSLGFTHANYASHTAAQRLTKGEEFMPISLSFITGINLINFFEMWGIDVPAEAEAQINSYGFPAWTEEYYVPALVETGTIGQEKGRAHAFRSMRASVSQPIYSAGTAVSIDGTSAFPVLSVGTPIVAPHSPGP